MTARSKPNDFGEVTDSFRFVLNQTIENNYYYRARSFYIEQFGTNKGDLL